jgi:hypothetical protein
MIPPMGDLERARAVYRAATDGTGGNVALLVHALGDGDLLVRLVAAIGLSRLTPERLPEPVVREMLATVIAAYDEPSVARAFEEVAATEDDCPNLQQELVLALGRLPAGSADFAVPQLVGLWSRDRSFYEAALAAVCLSFPTRATTSVAAHDLTPMQAGVLDAVVGDRSMWEACGDTPEVLAARGLPDTRPGMYAVLRRFNG